MFFQSRPARLETSPTDYKGKLEKARLGNLASGVKEVLFFAWTGAVREPHLPKAEAIP